MITYGFATNNPKKAAEYAAQLAKYNRAIRVLPYMEDAPAFHSQIEQYLKTVEAKECFVLREKSDLYVAEAWDLGIPEISAKLTQGEKVYNVSFLDVYTLDAAGVLSKRSYRAELAGHIDLTRRRQDADSLWWDDIFVLDRSDASYFEEIDLWGKTSARQQVLGQFVCEHIAFKGLRDWNFDPHTPLQAVDFAPEFSLENLLRKNVFVEMAGLRDSPWGLGNALAHIANDGVFFRSARSIRSNNYFTPPLSGVPRYQKRDPFHEFTFRLHDLFHQAIPDQIFSGQDSPEHRRVYVATRLMSEGLTLVLADMLFVKAIKDSGFEYDFTTRKIFPLFEALSLPQGDHRAQLKALLKANVAFANLGDHGPYRAMLRDEESSALEQYAAKFTHFFVPDLIWSAENYDDMAARKDMFAYWVDLVGKDLLARAKLPLLDDLVKTLKGKGVSLSSYEGCVGPVFEHLFDNVLSPKLEPTETVSEERQQSNAFLRYMIGQCFLYSTFRHVKGMGERGARMVDALKSAALFGQDDIERIRSMYRDDLGALRDAGIITADDFGMYKQIFPIFSPRFLSYDPGKATYNNVPEAIKAAFAD